MTYNPLLGRRPTTKMLRDADKATIGCNTLYAIGHRPLNYLAFFADADERAKRGETQKRCAVCMRYRWPDVVKDCHKFKEDASCA